MQKAIVARILSLLAIPVLGSVLLAAPQASEQPAGPLLFANTDQPALPGVGEDEVTIRSRVVELDIDLLVNTSTRTGGQGLVALNMFPDANVVARLDRVEEAYGGGLIWIGTVEGQTDADVVFSIMEDAVCASINVGEEMYRVSYAGNGVHRVAQVDPMLFKGCGTDFSLAVASPGEAKGGSTDGSRGTPDIMILVVYSTEAKNVSGGTNGMNSKINLAITETNQGYANSLVDQDLVLVHTEEMVGYTESSNFGTILTHLKSKNDGNMDSVHALRDQYAADAVAMICKNGQYCGIAYLMTNVSPGFESSAFCVVNYSCATGYFSFGHELGHNFGCAHDPPNAGGAAYNYSYGFRTSNNQYRTIMAYAPGTRKKYFSSPLVTFNGWTMGAALQDNARSLNNTADTVAAWRDSPPSDPTAEFTASPTSGDEDLLVAFSDQSSGTGITSWFWTFGDGLSSSAQNPGHLYTDAGTYTVALTVTGTNGVDTETKVGYIVVNGVVDAWANTRNGSGINPDIFDYLTLPILGTNWQSEVDAGSIGGSGLVMVFIYSGGLPGIVTSYGELLIDPSSAWMYTDIAFVLGGKSSHSIAIPADPAFAGTAAFAQAFMNGVGPAGQLTNAIDLVVGQ